MLQPWRAAFRSGAPAGTWVLVTDGTGGQNRSALAAVRAVAAAGYRAAVTVTGRGSLAAASRHCSRIVRVPPVDDAAYAGAVQAEAAEHGYLTVLPASDAAVLALQAPGRELLDKARLGELAGLAGLRVPQSRRVETWDELRAVAAELPLPCVVKPVLRSSSRHRPARRFDDVGQLLAAPPAAGPLLVQPAVEGRMHAVCGVVHGGRLRAVVHQEHVRIWPPRAGDACWAVTTEADADRESALERLLAGYEGLVQAEFCGDHLLDVNPRVYGSLPLALAAGVNPVQVWCDLLRGVDPGVQRARPGVAHRWWEGDLRHLAAQLRAGTLSLPAAGRALGTSAGRDGSAARDPWPTAQRWAHAVRRIGSRAGGSDRD